MKGKLLIAALVAAFAAIMVGAMATSAKAQTEAPPVVTLNVVPGHIDVGGNFNVSGTVYSTGLEDFWDSVESNVYVGAGCHSNALLDDFAPTVEWSTLFDGTYAYSTTMHFAAGTYSFDALYWDNNGFSNRPCVNVTVGTVIPPAPPPPNMTWACFSHFEDAPIAMTVAQFTHLTKDLELVFTKDPTTGAYTSALVPAWTNGFIPFANKVVGGQKIGGGYYLHCNAAGPPVTPAAWVDTDGDIYSTATHATFVARYGTPTVDPAGSAAAFNNYPVVP